MMEWSFFAFGIFLALVIVRGFKMVFGHTGEGSYQATAPSHELLASDLEQSAFRYEGVRRNPVILIHGLFGAAIIDETTGRELWGRFGLKGLTPDEFVSLAHPMKQGIPLADLRDATHDHAILESASVSIAGLELPLKEYGRLTEVLKSIGYRKSEDPDGIMTGEGTLATLYEFHYDWRRDLVENARRLFAFLEELRLRLNKAYCEHCNRNSFDVHFDLVAHSMGGLVARYCLMYGGDDPPEPGETPNPHWKIGSYVDKLVQISTPNAGYLDTISELVCGLQIAPGAPRYRPGLIGTFPSYYFMLPETSSGGELFAENNPGKALDPYDADVWLSLRLGLLNPTLDGDLVRLLPDVPDRAGRVRVAEDHVRKCLARAVRFRTALNASCPPPSYETELFLFSGNTTRTARKAEIRADGSFRVTERSAGDGKVLVSSCRFDQNTTIPFFHSSIPWRAMYLLDATHTGILDDARFTADFRFCLLLHPTEGQKRRYALSGPSEENVA